jgi:signal transduction histidine kinase
LAIAFVLHRAVLLSERRGAFVSAVTHELRTPLTTFRLYSEMLADDMVPDPERRREYLTTLCDESTRLMHLVENVLSFSRIERGRTAARMELVSVESLIQRIEPRLRQRTDQVGLLLKTDVNRAAGLACVKVDALAVEQILFNLTDNACKYAAPDSDPQELQLSVVVEGKDINFTLRDFGPGLPKQARKKLFQPFAKSATEAAHSAPGVGLGLALCRRLARELGGRLTHQAVSGRGACFCLSLPQQA